MSVVNIVPVEKPQTPIIETAVCISIGTVDLGVSATINVQLLNANGSVVEVQQLVLEQPDYSYWGTDDRFVINWTLQKLGLSRPSL